MRQRRVGIAYGFLPALLAGAYALATWSDAHRTGILTVAAGMILLHCALSPGRHAVLIGGYVNLAGSLAFGLLDGGVTGPLGAFVPASLVLLAIVYPPRAFAVYTVVALLAYLLVVAGGGPAPAGYAVVHALGFGGTALLCLRHAGVLNALRRRLSESSRTDPLTGCLNRRGFDEQVAAGLAAAARSGEPATLVLLDLDHFKSVNDAHGHQAGDDLLAWAGHELQAGVRVSGAAGRLGGDEFALFLPGTDATAAAVAVERIRERLSAGTPSSLGFATFPADGADPAALALAADARLYADKQSHQRRAPSPAEVARARTRIEAVRPSRPVAAHDRRRHSIADPGRMAMAQTLVALIYVAAFAGGHRHQAAMAAICVWGFAAGLAVVSAADWLSRTRYARPLMLAFSVSSFLSLAAVAALDGGVQSPLGVGMLLAVPLMMFGMRGSVAVPLAVAAGALYVAVAVVTGGAGPAFVTINLLSTAALAVACGRQGWVAAHRRRMLTRLARVDALTDVLNRRGFADRLTAGIPAGAGLLVVDLDAFKQLNDARGHAAGDELLRWVAATLRERVGPDDVVGRLGGDEFVVLVHGDVTATARLLSTALAERTRASIGGAVQGADGDGFDELYAAADARLYESKASRARTRAAVA